MAPLVSMHHVDFVHPIFPRMNRIHALQRLFDSAKHDDASLLQQSICYDSNRQWSRLRLLGLRCSSGPRLHVPPRARDAYQNLSSTGTPRPTSPPTLSRPGPSPGTLPEALSVLFPVLEIQRIQESDHRGFMLVTATNPQPCVRGRWSRRKTWIP